MADKLDELLAQPGPSRPGSEEHGVHREGTGANQDALCAPAVPGLALACPQTARVVGSLVGHKHSEDAQTAQTARARLVRATTLSAASRSLARAPLRLSAGQSMSTDALKLTAPNAVQYQRIPTTAAAPDLSAYSASRGRRGLKVGSLVPSLLRMGDPSFSRQQWHTGWPLFIFCQVTINLPGYFNPDYTRSMFVSSMLSSAGMIALCHLTSRVPKGRDSSPISLCDTFFYATLAKMPVYSHDVFTQYMAHPCTAPRHAEKMLSFDDVIYGSIVPTTSTFAFVLSFMVLSFPWWQRIVIFGCMNLLQLVAYWTRICNGEEYRVFGATQLLAFGAGVLSGLVLETMHKLSHLSKVHAQKKTDTVLAHCPTALIALNLECRISNLNTQTATMLGISREQQVAGLDFTSTFIASSCRSKTRQAFKDAFAGARTQSLQLTLKQRLRHQVMLLAARLRKSRY